ncbi:MAG: low molecular weight protein-tyrosine-phosphatase [Faecousia sp.]
MIKILFVCHGNICRSPMGEYILKDMALRAGRGEEFEIDSAAVSREEIGSGVYPPARRELERRGIPCGGHRARQVTTADYRHFDRIYYMDASNARYLARMLPRDPEKIRPLLDRDVADPWYTGDFSQTFTDICEGCEKIMEEFA